MKLAEALQERSDLQNRIHQLKERLIINAKVQEGEEPTESPEELLQELDDCMIQLENMIVSINKTNSIANEDGISPSELIAKRDILNKKIDIYKNFIDESCSFIDRYSKDEVKIVTTVNIEETRCIYEHLLADLRETESRIQQKNWTIDLINYNVN